LFLLLGPSLLHRHSVAIVVVITIAIVVADVSFTSTFIVVIVLFVAPSKLQLVQEDGAIVQGPGAEMRPMGQLLHFSRHDGRHGWVLLED
jgi:hypothetical protein